MCQAGAEFHAPCKHCGSVVSKIVPVQIDLLKHAAVLQSCSEKPCSLPVDVVLSQAEVLKLATARKNVSQLLGSKKFELSLAQIQANQGLKAAKL